MQRIKNFDEFIQKVKTDVSFQNELKENPVEAMKNINFSGPVYTTDKLIYRIVIIGFVGVLLLGVIFFIYQYQRSLDIRTTYANKVLDTINQLKSSDSLALSKIENLKSAIVSSNGLNATTPDGVIAVFTAIIGVLAGLFAPSPIGNKNNNE